MTDFPSLLVINCNLSPGAKPCLFVWLETGLNTSTVNRFVKSDVPEQLRDLLLAPLTFTKQLSVPWTEWICCLSWWRTPSWALRAPKGYPTFTKLFTSLRQCGNIFQDQQILSGCLLSLRGLNRPHCNYDMPLMLKFSKRPPTDIISRLDLLLRFCYLSLKTEIRCHLWVSNCF